ncbi:MAG: hypothetical protein ACOYVK_18280 [Bacillota bacterium]
MNLLPKSLREKSISNEKIVLPYTDVLEAIEILNRQNWAVTAWEGWIKYPAGMISRSFEFPGIDAVTRHQDECWSDYIERAAAFCKQTIRDSQDMWNEKCSKCETALFFYITAVEQS